MTDAEFFGRVGAICVDVLHEQKTPIEAADMILKMAQKWKKETDNDK